MNSQSTKPKSGELHLTDLSEAEYKAIADIMRHYVFIHRLQPMADYQMARNILAIMGER